MISLQNVSIHLPLRRARLRRRLISGGGSSGGEIVYDGRLPFVAALQNISLKVHRGDCVALLGHNGSGKTTLLRTMAGIYEPRNGTIEVRGKLATMFSSSLSLSDMETGLQNIEFASILHGIPVEILKKRLPNIIDICELGAFIEIPVSMYSEGMRARLGLAMAIVSKPEILLIDEAMTATDTHFLTKITKKTNLIGGKNTVSIIATHTQEIQKKLCNRAIWLEHGHLKMIGKYGPVRQAYNEHSSS